MAPPFKECEFDIMYGKGISRVGEVLDTAVDLGIVKKGGAWFSYEDYKLGQGRDNSKQFLLDHPDIMAEIESKIKASSAEMIAAAGQKNDKKSKLEEKANAGAGISEASEPDSSAEEDFEEFAPIDIGSLGE